jgi:alkylated DNA repair dioxygenase AlkB
MPSRPYDSFVDNQELRATSIDLPESDITLYKHFFNEPESRKFMVTLLDEIQWKQERISFYGKTYDLPRLTAWYGDPNKTYRYSGITVQSLPWIAVLEEIKSKIESVSRVKFNSVLLNRYRSGTDSVSWHSDDECQLGRHPVIGSVSFGQSRLFKLKHKSTKQRKHLELINGSYLLMKGATQDNWLHEIPKNKCQGERVNLTFRVIG